MAFPRRSLAPLLSLVVFGCAQGGLHYVEPAYRDAALANERLIVYPIDGVRIEPRARELLEAGFEMSPGADGEAILAESFNTKFPEALRESAREIRIERYVGATARGADLRARTLELGWREDELGSWLHLQVPLRFSVPARSSFRGPDGPPRWLLLVQNVVFDAESTSSGTCSFGETPDGYPLYFRCFALGFEYLVWDYQEEKALASGLGGNTLFFALLQPMFKWHWREVVRNSAQELRLGAVLGLSREERAVEPFMIHPVSRDQIRLQNRDDFEDDFDPPRGSDYEAILAEFFNREFVKAVENGDYRTRRVAVKPGGTETDPGADSFVVELLADVPYARLPLSRLLGKKATQPSTSELTFQVPSREFLERAVGSARFVLILQNLRLGDGMSCSPISGGPVYGDHAVCSWERYASLAFDYLLWDAREERPVSYGFGAESTGAEDNVALPALIAESAQRFLSESPLR